MLKPSLATSLPLKVSVLIAALFVCYAAAQFLVQQQILYPSFVALEDAEALKNSERALKALDRELELLAPQVADWSAWDDTYTFLQDGNQAYIDENLTPEAMQHLQIDYLGFVDLDGNVIWQRALNPATGKPLAPANMGFGTFDKSGALLRARIAFEPGVRGLRKSALGPVLVAARAVVRSDSEGPPRGILVMARVLDRKGIARLASQAEVDLKLGPIPDHLATHAVRATPSGVAYQVSSPVKSGAVSRSIITVFDLESEPAFQLRIDTPRAITAQGQRALRSAQITLAAAAITVLLVVLFTLNRLVFRPISTLTRHAMEIGTSDALEARLDVHRDDEIGVFGREFNRMVDRWAEARARLLEQSYHAGIAEMASGVLHNIGNAITPLGIKLSGIVDEIRQAPLREIRLAGAELADPATPADRRQDLQHFLLLAAADLATLADHTDHSMTGALAHVDHIELVLADQERFARAEPVVEELTIARTVRECIALLSPEALRFTAIELSPTLDLAPPVRVSRAALRQIITNLLVNATESISAQRGRGTVRIETKIGIHCGEAALRTEFIDDGVGIAADDLRRIFEAGVSTKNRGSGIGLHWSANAIATMGGALWAESAGHGAGACMVMVLPLAEALMISEKAA